MFCCFLSVWVCLFGFCFFSLFFLSVFCWFYLYKKCCCLFFSFRMFCLFCFVGEVLSVFFLFVCFCFVLLFYFPFSVFLLVLFCYSFHVADCLDEMHGSHVCLFVCFRVLPGISALPNPRASPITQNWTPSIASQPRRGLPQKRSDTASLIFPYYI